MAGKKAKPEPRGKVEVPAASGMRLLVTSPVVVITTVDGQGRANGGAFGAYFRAGRSMYAAIHPGSHTYENLKATGEAVVNLPGRDRIESIMVFGRDYDAGVNEIERAGLTELAALRVKPPRIAEYRAHVEVKLREEMRAGSHALLVLECLAASCDAGLWDGSAFDLVQAGVLHIARYPEPVYIAAERYVTGTERMDGDAS